VLHWNIFSSDRILQHFPRSFCSNSGGFLSVEQGRILHRFTPSLVTTDLRGGTESALDFGIDSDPSPLVLETRNSIPVIQGGRGCSYGSHSGRPGIPASSDGSGRFRSKRSEELYKRAHMIFDGPAKVRIMDVDRFDLNDLHHFFMASLVRHFPAESCVRVASRIALFRDKSSQHSFESMSKDVAELFGPTHGAELSALFARCFNTIPVAFMLDYIRRFGKFSRKYIASQVDKTTNPRLFDFVRYSSAVKPLPGIVTRPFSLRSFAKLLPPCSSKRYIFQHLLATSGDIKAVEALQRREEESDLTILERLTSGSHMDPKLGFESRVSEKLTCSWRTIKRPDVLFPIELDVNRKQPVAADDIIKELESGYFESYKESSSSDPLLLQRTQVHKFHSPLMSDAEDLMINDKDNKSEVMYQVDIFESEGSTDSWWKKRSITSEFFRMNKNAYRLVQGEGWKKVEDPRGKEPDYERSRKLRDGRVKMRSTFARLARKKLNTAVIKGLVRKRISELV
jgi:hypothetical protein